MRWGRCSCGVLSPSKAKGMPWFSSCDYCKAQGSAFHGAPMFMLRARWLELAFRSHRPPSTRAVRSALYGASAQPQHRIPHRCNAAFPAVATLHPPLPQHHASCRCSAAFPAALMSPQHRIPRCSSAALLAAATPYSPLLQHRVLYCCFANVSRETFVRNFARSLSATHSQPATRPHASPHAKQCL